jgi:hypothetical protein
MTNFVTPSEGATSPQPRVLTLYLFSAIRLGFLILSRVLFFSWLPAKRCAKKRGCLLPN